MNKEYTYVDGKVIVIDDKGNQTLTEYYDNLDEVLGTENSIEIIEGKIKELEEESEKYKKVTSKRYFPSTATLAAILSVVLPPLLFSLSGINIFTDCTDTFLGPMNTTLACMGSITAITLPLGTLYSLVEYDDYKNTKKREKGVNSELEFLKKRLSEEKEKISSLKKNKSRDNENTEFRNKKVDNFERQKSLNDNLDFYYDLGYNGEKYYRYYQQGKLDKKMDKRNYSELDIQVAKEYLEEKEPTLVKRRNSKR